MKPKVKFYIVVVLSMLVVLAIKIKFANTKVQKELTELVEKQEAKDEINLVSENTELQNGDLIFHASLSSQSKAIQLITNSPYSHCGIVYKEGADFYVFEAVQPVKQTLLNQWIARGEDGHYVVKRLKNAKEILTQEVLDKMKEIGQKFLGKSYDLGFEWTDDKMYCSELIWKIYQRAVGVEIGKLEKLGDFDLSNPLVQYKIKERYGDKIPLEETVISPAAIFDSEHLVLVKKV